MPSGMDATVRWGVTLSYLQQLYLSHCNLAAVDIERFVHAFKNHNTLKGLHLDHNPLADSGIVALCAGLMYLTTLQKLELTATGVTAQGVDRLLFRLASEQKSLVLEIEENPAAEVALAVLRGLAYALTPHLEAYAPQPVPAMIEPGHSPNAAVILQHFFATQSIRALLQLK